MASVLLAWNLDLPDPWPEGYGPALAAVEGGGTVRRRITGCPQPPGTEVWLVLRGSSGRGPRGLAGHGIVPADTGADTVSVDFDLLLPLGEQIPEPLLHSQVTGLPAAALTGLTPVPPAAVPSLRSLWSGFLGAGADPLSPLPGTLDEQAIGRQRVNAYEHDAEARRLCLAFHGNCCAACGLVPARRFGLGTEALMQVHHLVAAAAIPAGYVLDPVADLVPLCPTCHAVAHTRVPVPYTPAEVRALLDGAADAADRATFAGSGQERRDAVVVAGSVVTAEQQQALEDAARLRGFR